MEQLKIVVEVVGQGQGSGYGSNSEGVGFAETAIMASRDSTASLAHDKLLTRFLDKGYEMQMAEDYKESPTRDFWFYKKASASLINEGDYMKTVAREANWKNVRAAGTLVARQAVNTTVSSIKYTSGNSAYNHSLDKANKLTNYASAFAITGMMNPTLLVPLAIGTAVSEAGNLISNTIQYNHQRKISMDKRATTTAALGNLSYGRPRD